MQINSVLLESESRFDFPETLQQIEKQAVEKGWMIPTRHDLKATLGKTAIDVLDVTILELCNSSYSATLMREDEFRYISSLMPSRISVYVKYNGKTFVSRVNSTMLSMFMGGTIGQVMGQSGDEIESLLRAILVEEPLPDF